VAIGPDVMGQMAREIGDIDAEQAVLKFSTYSSDDATLCDITVVYIDSTLRIGGEFCCLQFPCFYCDTFFLRLTARRGEINHMLLEYSI